MILSLARFFRLLIGILDLVLLTLILYPLSFLPKKWTKSFYPRLFHYWCKVFVSAFGIELRLHQKNKRPLPHHYIVISNHPSAFEDIGMPSLFNARFLAKREVEHWWIGGRIAKAGGTLFFHRESKEGRNEGTQKMIEVLEKGHNIGLYPEGGCKGRRINTPFRYGIFDISLKTNTPIIPVFLHYEIQEDFEWLTQHLLHKIWTILTSQNKRAHYYVYDAIYPSQFNNKEEYCQYVQDLYLDLQKRYLD